MVSAWGCKTALDSLTSVQVILLQEQRSIKYQSKAVISGFWKRLQACYLSCTSVFFLPYHTTPSNLESALSDDSIPPVPTLPPLDSRKVINSALIIQPFPCGPALFKVITSICEELGCKWSIFHRWGAFSITSNVFVGLRAGIVQLNRTMVRCIHITWY